MKRIAFIIFVAAVCLMQNILISQAEESSMNENAPVNFVEVQRMSNLDFTDKSKEEIDKILLEEFIPLFDKSYFDRVTTENWLAKFESCKAALMNKAAGQDLDDQSLGKCLTRIIRGQNTAFLPIGAYLTKSGDSDVWVILCRWQYIYKDKQPMGFDYICVKALRADNQSEIGFVSQK